MSTQPPPFDLDAIQARVRHLEAETSRLRAAWNSARTRASNLRERLDNADHGRDRFVEAIEQMQAENDRLRDVLKSTQAIAALDSATCESCGHLESAHDPDGDRDCNASGARVRQCTCAYFIACYPEPAT
ncbi:hypothetical protein [Streptomyces sp. Y1]|uniref:Uncharacterized protein n=1 Tax=Streptomyces sp. Y1 TaxID=3238634 RepID=A0AB39TJP4_9ACTN